ncbi:MAG: mevalonate kinase [Anaerolineales bacterium]
MQTFTASAPGKIILFGEHAVVYGQPAIAVPVTQVQATATVEPIPGEMLGTGHIIAPQINLDAVMGELPPDNPLVTAIRNLQTALGAGEHLAFRLRIHSTIPVAAGLGSGAAVSAAVIRAFSAFLGRVLPDEDVSVLAYQVEKIHHGTPSGIDNTVVVYARPVYFIRG